MLPYTIHAELTADGERIILMAAGQSNEDVAYAAQLLQLCTPLFQDTKPPGALQVKVSWPAVVQLATTYGTAWRPGPRLTAWMAEEIRRRMSAPAAMRYTPPEGLTPRPYQVDGAQIIGALGSALITDEPGTGKTITTILGLMERHHHDPKLFEHGPVIVVCPASVVDPWVEAWLTWAPSVVAVAWRGSPERRLRLIGQADVYVVSYDTATRDAKPYTRKGSSPLVELKPTGLVIDECHLIKNPDARRSLAVRRIAKKTRSVVALSGTPITHHSGDLWPTLVAVQPNAYPARERFTARYCMSIPGDYDETIIGLNPASEPEFRTALLGQHRRVAKADVLPQLPRKEYSTRTVELPPEWRKAYDAIESQMLADLPGDSGELSSMTVLAQLGHLSRLASSAADVEITEAINEKTGLLQKHYHLKLKAPSWKVDVLLEVLAERPGSPVVAFTPSKQLAVLAGETATKAGYKVGYVVGGQSAKERTETVATFQRGELDLICATTGAGGVGITLTAAATVVFLQRPYSLVEALQAEDRCHRIGSEVHNYIEIIDIVAKGTIDTRVRAVLKNKAGQLAELLQDPRIVTELLGGSAARDLRKAS